MFNYAFIYFSVINATSSHDKNIKYELNLNNMYLSILSSLGTFANQIHITMTGIWKWKGSISFTSNFICERTSVSKRAHTCQVAENGFTFGCLLSSILSKRFSQNKNKNTIKCNRILRYIRIQSLWTILTHFQ